MAALKASELFAGLVAGRRDCLARAITLVESSRRDHQREAQILLQMTANISKTQTHAFQYGQTLRLGIAGPPGAGKSTFIEKLGMQLIHKKHRVAVIPVDPSSHISGGSILGDKTRMDLLSREDDAYIRASPTRGILGGIAEHTADVISLCESAKYDTVIIESVGLGQSEVDIDKAVDMLLIIVPPGGGDGLQASKKGIMEAADGVIVNKADGAFIQAANHTKSDYAGSLQFVLQKYPFWRPKVLLASAATGLNMDLVESEIRSFHKAMCENKALQKKRAKQRLFWMWGGLNRQILNHIETHDGVMNLSNKLTASVEEGTLTPSNAASLLTREFFLNPPQYE